MPVSPPYVDGQLLYAANLLAGFAETVNITGDTMTGNLFLPNVIASDPTQAVTKYYVDTTANVVIIQNNVTYILAQSAFDQANVSNTLAQTAYDSSNNVSNTVNTIYATVNNNTNVISSVYNLANNNAILAQAAFDKANAAYTQANTPPSYIANTPIFMSHPGTMDNSELLMLLGVTSGSHIRIPAGLSGTNIVYNANNFPAAQTTIMFSTYQSNTWTLQGNIIVETSGSLTKPNTPQIDLTTTGNAVRLVGQANADINLSNFCLTFVYQKIA